jgi:ABC-type polysaccharide/polyol phosphate transport system ATPase subunit
MTKTIEIQNLKKTFPVNIKKNQGALAKLLDIITGKKLISKKIVLENISFDVEEKEIIGLIGKNGAGKSTLLRVIAGIYKKNDGKLKTNGEVTYLNGFNTGLKDRLTMKENIFLMGSILGLSQKQIKNKFEEIVEFSGLGENSYDKIYQFSDGMIARLAFSITIHCLKQNTPDIILLDEIIFGSSADLEFQERAITKMEELIKSGATVIISSHNLELIKKYCSKVIWLDKGKIKKIGEPEPIIKEYENEALQS